MLKSLIKDVSIYGLADFVFKAISFLTFPIYAYLFTLEEFSTMSLVLTLVCLVNLFLNLGNINNAVQRFYWDGTQDAKKAVVTTGIICLLAASILLGIFLFLTLFTFEAPLITGFGFTVSLLLYAFLGGMLNNILAFTMNVIRLHFTPWRFCMLSMGTSALTVILSMMFVWKLKLGVEGYFLGILFANLVFAPVGLLMIKKDLACIFDSALAKEMIAFSYPFLFMAIIYWAIGSIDRWMLFEFSDLDQVGLYSIAFRFATVINLLAMAFGQAFSPQALKIYSEKPSMFPEFIHQSFILLTLSLTGVWSVISFFAPDFLYWMTPEPYWAAYHSLIYICLGTAILGISQITAFPITLAKKTQLFNYASIFSMMVNIFLNWLLIPSYGGVGAGIASACSYLVLTVSYWGIAQFLPTRFSIDLKFCISLGVYIIFTLVILQSRMMQEVTWQSFLLKISYLSSFVLFSLIVLKKQKILPSLNWTFGGLKDESSASAL